MIGRDFMIGYILIMLTIFAVTLAFVLPVMHQLLTEVFLTTEESLQTIATTSPSDSLAPTAPTGDVVGFMLIFGVFTIGLFVLFFIIQIVNRKAKEEEPSRLEKTPLADIHWNEVWAQRRKLSPDIQMDLLTIRNKINALLPRLEEPIFQFELHTVRRMYEDELIHLLKSYVDLTYSQQRAEKPALDEAIASMKLTLETIEHNLETSSLTAFQKNVGVIEKRYTKRKHLRHP